MLTVFYPFLEGPAIAELAATDPGGWAEDYLRTENEQPQADWSNEFMKEGPTQMMQVPPVNRRWAEEYLDHTENRAW